jgi:hypothetical protein
MVTRDLEEPCGEREGGVVGVHFRVRPQEYLVRRVFRLVC